MYSDPELDFFSPNFNAAKTLASNNVVLPYPDARPLDNLSKCAEFLPEARKKIDDMRKAKAAKEEQQREFIAKLSETASWSGTVIRESKVDRSQQPTPVLKPKEVREERPPLMDIIKESTKTGPLSMLRECFEAKARVRVTVRRARDIRGTLHGLVVAYDKHVNMVLRDVIEHYTEVHYRFVAAPPGVDPDARSPPLSETGLCAEGGSIMRGPFSDPPRRPPRGPRAEEVGWTWRDSKVEEQTRASGGQERPSVTEETQRRREGEPPRQEGGSEPGDSLVPGERPRAISPGRPVASEFATTANVSHGGFGSGVAGELNVDAVATAQPQPEIPGARPGGWDEDEWEDNWEKDLATAGEWRRTDDPNLLSARSLQPTSRDEPWPPRTAAADVMLDEEQGARVLSEPRNGWWVRELIPRRRHIGQLFVRGQGVVMLSREKFASSASG